MGQESPGHVPGGAGGAGGWSGHHVLRGLAGCLSSTEKAAKLGCYGLKIPGGDRESLKGNVKKKKSGNGEGERELLSKSFYVKIKFKKKRTRKKKQSLLNGSEGSKDELKGG